jgi:hypothetical protein
MFAQLAVWSSPERELIRLAEPPLNLTGWANANAADIRRLRRACAVEAREAA